LPWSAPGFVEEDQRAGARRRTYVAARCGRTASGNNAHFARRRQATAPPRQGGPFDGAPRVRPMCPHGAMPAGTAPRHRHTWQSCFLLPWRRQPYGRVEKSLPKLTNLGGELASFSPLLFRRGVANLSPSELTLHLECKVSFRGRGDEKASGDRVFCHFID